MIFAAATSSAGGGVQVDASVGLRLAPVFTEAGTRAKWRGRGQRAITLIHAHFVIGYYGHIALASLPATPPPERGGDVASRVYWYCPQDIVT